MKNTKLQKYYPWIVVALLWVVALLNYMDRQMLSTMRESMQVDIAELGGGRQFRPADGHLPLDLRTGESRCRGRRRPDQPQVAHRRIARRLVGRDAADGLFDLVRADLLAAGPDGHQRGALHSGQPFADRRLPHGQGPEFRHRRPHDRTLCRTGRGRIRGYGRLDVFLAGDLPLVRHHRHRLCRRADLLPA